MFKVLLILVSLVFYAEADGGIEFAGSQMNINRVKALVCDSDVKFAQSSGQIVAYQQWNQIYDGRVDRNICKLQRIQAFHTRFKITLEKFDNNTSIYASFDAYKGSDTMELVTHLTLYCSGITNKIISLDDSYNRYEIDNKMSYEDSKSIKFSCEKYSHISNYVQVGWINPAGDKYFPYNQSNIIITPTEEHNGSILCCLFYTVMSPDNSMFILERFVKDKTLLMVRRDTPSAICHHGTTAIKNGSDINNVLKTSNTVNSNNTKTTESTYTATATIKHTTNSTDSFEHTIARIKHITTMTDHIEHTKNTTRVVSDTTKVTDCDENTTNTTDSKRDNANERDHHSDTTNKIDLSEKLDEQGPYYVTIVLSISAIVILVAMILYALWRRCWKKKTRAQLPLPQVPRLQSPNEPDINTPFYVNMLFRSECEKEIQAGEEPEYEEIMYQ